MVVLILLEDTSENDLKAGRTGEYNARVHGAVFQDRDWHVPALIGLVRKRFGVRAPPKRGRRADPSVQRAFAAFDDIVEVANLMRGESEANQ